MAYAPWEMNPRLTNIFGLADHLRLPRKWLIAEADANRIPFLKVGQKRLFNAEAVRDALAKRAAESCKSEGPE